MVALCFQSVKGIFGFDLRNLFSVLLIVRKIGKERKSSYSNVTVVASLSNNV